MNYKKGDLGALEDNDKVEGEDGYMSLVLDYIFNTRHNNSLQIKVTHYTWYAEDLELLGTRSRERGLTRCWKPPSEGPR